jgi:hypothetical protein
LAAVSATHPEVCRLAETLMTEIAGVPVRERCKHGESPQCRLEIKVD